MTYRNETNEIVYYSNSQKRVVNEQEALDQVSSATIDCYNNFKSNGLNTLRRPGTYNYFAGLASIPPETVFQVHNNHYQILDSTKPQIISYSKTIDDLLLEVEKILLKFQKKKIGVELSGGLDSSLVIEALLRFKFEPILIGFTSENFEFRTERHVQNLYEKKVNNTILLKYEDHFAFSNLDVVPKHPIPVSESHFFSRHNRVAEIAKKNNIEILLSGEAGDQLLSFANGVSDNSLLPSDFYYWCLAEHWSNQYVYKNHGVQYLSGMALGNLPSVILSLRGIQNWDPMKIWARKKFRNCLPWELSDFAYTAFHNDWVSRGLMKASDIIEAMSLFTYRKFRISGISPSNLKKQANIYATMEQHERKEFLINLAFVVWFYSLKNN